MPLQSPGVNTIQQLRSFRASQSRIAWEEDSVAILGTSESHFQRGARRCLGRKFEAINRDCTVYICIQYYCNHENKNQLFLACLERRDGLELWQATRRGDVVSFLLEWRAPNISKQKETQMTHATWHHSFELLPIDIQATGSLSSFCITATAQWKPPLPDHARLAQLELLLKSTLPGPNNSVDQLAQWQAKTRQNPKLFGNPSICWFHSQPVLATKYVHMYI